MFSFLSDFKEHHQKATRETIEVDLSRNDLITENGMQSFKTSYIHKEGGEENPQDVYARVASYYGSHSRHAARMYYYMSKQWYSPATPILANGGTKRGRPISCNTNEVYDSRASIADVLLNENFWLATGGAGVGVFFGNIRSIGEKIKTGTTGGIFSFLPMLEALIAGSNQGSLRRSNAAVYLPCWHPEIEAFVKMRLHIDGGDKRRKIPGLHHGVILTEDFKQAIKRNLPWNLRSPKTGEIIKTINARELWYSMLMARMEKGEPYFIFDKAVQDGRSNVYKFHDFTIVTSNLCVAPETPILTDKGYKEIHTLEGKYVNAWNGEEFSRVKIEKTSTKAMLREIKLSDGSSLWVTDEHKFYVNVNYTKEVEVKAINIKPGDKLVKTNFPVISGDESFKNAYMSGFHTADGTYDRNNKPLIHIYNPKMVIISEATRIGGKVKRINDDRVSVSYGSGVLEPKFKVPMNADLKDKLEWLAGYLDGDGTVARNGDNEGIQFASINKDFINEVRLLLNTLGVSCTVSLAREAGYFNLPNGKGDSSLYKCHTVYRSCITSVDTQKLLRLGIHFRRLEVKIRNPSRSAKRFVTVVSNTDSLRESATYCATEEKRHRLVFNGHETGNCSEILLKTGKDQHGIQRTGVCCLSSLNLATWDEWKDNELFIRDVMEFLDNVLDDYISLKDPHIKSAIYAAYRERSVGLGVMGFHTYLQKNMIPMDSLPATMINKIMFKHIRKEADKASEYLAKHRGPCPDAQEAGLMERFSNKLAVAPTASISVLCGEVSPGIEPMAACIFSRRAIAANQTVYNLEFFRTIEKLGLDVEAIRTSVAQNNGSCQHIPEIPDDVKAVFKTAREIDQRFIVDMAADRTPYICQAASTNLFVKANIHKVDLHRLHMRAWDKECKSLYYLRSESTLSDSDSKFDKAPASKEEYEECTACQ